MRNGLIILIGAIILSGCCPKLYPTKEHRDSVRVEIHERVVHDSVEIEIPTYVEVVSKRDTSSHLENPYAESDAVMSGGVLTHSLKTKPHTEIKYIDRVVHDTTTIEVHDKAETIVEYVEKPKSDFERTEIIGFWVLLTLFVVAAWFKMTK